MTTTTKKADTLAAAFLRAQSEFPEIPKDADATKRWQKDGRWHEFTYHYASLPAIIRTCFPILHKHGLSFSQEFHDGDLVTLIRNTDGAEFDSRLPMPDPRSMKPQDYGSVVTYMRRYAAVAMLGIAPDDDTDAAGVEVPPPAQPPLAEPQPPADDAPPLTEDDDATDKYLAAVGDLVDRGVVALTKIGNWDDPADEMRERMERVLKQFDVALPVSIDSRADRLKFYHLFEATVKAIEADAEAVEEVGL